MISDNLCPRIYTFKCTPFSNDQLLPVTVFKDKCSSALHRTCLVYEISTNFTP